jgi:hypothetical protein
MAGEQREGGSWGAGEATGEVEREAKRWRAAGDWSGREGSAGDGFGVRCQQRVHTGTVGERARENVLITLFFFAKKRSYLSLNSYLYFMRIRERLHNLPTVIH